MMNMKINRVIVGMLETNCYILEQDNNYLIIDPGDEADKISSMIKGQLCGIIITHYHFDHILALEELVQKYQVKVYDYHNLIEGINHINNFTFEMINTPGHKSDLISLLFDNNLFCGDFIFKGTIGRTDLDTGNFKEMQYSIRKIIKLNKDIIIYPGHGNITTLNREYYNLIKYI